MNLDCATCNGAGWTSAADEADPCHDCAGTGIDPAIPRCERCDALIVGIPVVDEWDKSRPFCSTECVEAEAEWRASR